MDHETGAASHSLNQRLQEHPYDFDFFQAVRRLESAHPHLPRVGCSQRPQGDLIRFCQKVSLAFEPSAIEAYFEPADEGLRRLSVTFLGLLGTNGPMPLCITEYVYDRLHNHRDKTLACFLDIFNHRMISLFYRAWACNQQTVSHDRKEDDRFAFYIGSLFGIGMDSFFKRDAVPDVAKLHYAGRLSCQTKNAEGLQEILHDYFGVPVAIEEFVEQWIELPREYCCQLGKSLDNASLGSTSIVGSRFLECQQKFRIKCGPMSFSDYERLLPGSESLGRFVTWIRNYIGDELSWELNLVLRHEEIPRICLGEVGQLGWTTWLGSRKFEKDADNLVLQNLTA
ncbi:MAG: type VI secretion system baseplate subunit TssG [Sedimentisphaerales bacterium]